MQVVMALTNNANPTLVYRTLPDDDCIEREKNDTKKKGSDALEVCPDHASHGNLNQPVHQRPKGLDLDYIYKNFTRAATSSENKSADWQTLKKKKN